MSELTPKQEKFAQSVASGMTQADAYRSAYSASKMKASSIQENASRLMANVKVKARVEQLREPIIKKAQLTLENHLEDLKGLRNMAVKKEQYSAAIAAEVARGKAAGLYIERTEISGAGGGPIQQSTMTPEQYEEINRRLENEV